ncbi:hypothetical protein [Bosea sp. PAMC 26642]|uniref:hypothetical protein n=1 Tax=Bosea sp. (strain PAMC 26642) TaxID=1792307 RepID=UPI00076FF04A|nr:hypothetical protein [Bosea sp. PAMC 26642]AMJ59360.1 hypothetical protein AXW83_02725 [Bosea sp. PAMC 26642]
MSNLFDRRRMLLGLAAASTAAATVTAAGGAKASENPELFRLASELPALSDHYHAARKHQDVTEAHWSPLWPLAPDDITEPGHPGWHGSPIERGLRGGALMRPGEAEPRRLISAFHFGFQVNRARRVLNGKKLTAGLVDGRTRAEWETELAEDERCHALAVTYEAETKRISEASNYTASWQAHSAAAAALEVHVGLIMGQPDLTMEGLIIKAQALEVWGRVDELYRLSRRGADWHGQIAASILRHASAAA